MDWIEIAAIACGLLAGFALLGMVVEGVTQWLEYRDRNRWR